MTTKTFMRNVAGTDIEVTLSMADFDPAGTLVREAEDLPGRMGLAVCLLADYTGRLRSADAQYRAFRGQAAEEILQRDGKLPEWRVKALVESLPTFVAHKEYLASLEGDLAFLEGYIDVARTKAQMLKIRKDLA